MIRRAIEESTRIDQESRQVFDEEEEMIRQAILLSQQEEEARIKRIQQLEEEQIRTAQKLSTEQQKLTKVETAVAQIKINTLAQEKETHVKKLQ